MHRATGETNRAQVRAASELRMSIEERLTYEEIGRRHGVSKGQVSKDISAILNEYRAAALKDAGRFIEAEALRLDFAWQQALKVYLACKDPDQALKAIAMFVTISQSYRKLRGLDAAAKHEVSGVDGGPIELEAVQQSVLAKLHATLRSVPAIEAGSVDVA